MDKLISESIASIESFFIDIESSLVSNRSKWVAGIFIIVGILVIVSRKITDASYKSGSESGKRGKYTDPYEYETYVAKRLKGFGYKNITTTRGSHDFGADIICEKQHEKYSVQVKMYTGSVGYRAIEEAIAGMHYYGCSKSMVITTGHFSKQAIEAAEQMGVILIENFI